jgi:hypothetical protein
VRAPRYQTADIGARDYVSTLVSASRLLSGSRAGFVGWGVCSLTTPGNGQLKVADTPINISVSRPATILHELTLLKVSNGRRPRGPIADALHLSLAREVK